MEIIMPIKKVIIKDITTAFCAGTSFTFLKSQVNSPIARDPKPEYCAIRNTEAPGSTPYNNNTLEGNNIALDPLITKTIELIKKIFFSFIRISLSF
jgi:hypothetical protein